MFSRKDIEKKLSVKLKGAGIGWLYEWAGNGMLAKVTLPMGSKVVFNYDPLGRRIAKQYKGKVTRWLWDGNVPLHEWQYEGEYPPKLSIDDNNKIEEQPEPTENVITWLFEENSFVPCGKIVGNEKYSIVSDYLGTPTHANREDGSLIWEREIDVYGALRKGNNEFVPFLYQGQYVDRETGDTYNRFRYCSSESGMYLSQDPIGLEGGIRLYGYVNDVNGWIDELGLTARNNEGIASGNGKAIGDKWLKGTHGNAGLFPKEIADNLRGKSFNSFKDFREAFWKEVASNPKYSSGFSPRNIKRMEVGRAPKAHNSQWDGKVGSYQLHHKTPIHTGGGVFDMDNLIIVTPRYHKEVLDSNYHYKRKTPHH